MRKLYFLLLLLILTGIAPAYAAVQKDHAGTVVELSSKTPVGMLVKGFFRKIFTGKEQMSEKKIKRNLRRHER